MKLNFAHQSTAAAILDFLANSFSGSVKLVVKYTPKGR